MHNLTGRKFQACCEYHITPAVVKSDSLSIKNSAFKNFREVNIVLNPGLSGPVRVLRWGFLFCVLERHFGETSYFRIASLHPGA